MYDYVQLASLLTRDGDSFVLRADRERNLIVFSCVRNLRTLCEGSTLYVDGTFQLICQFFFQLFTVHAFIKGYYIPLVFALINSKHMQSYANVFETVVEKFVKNGLHCLPTTMYPDFEDIFLFNL